MEQNKKPHNSIYIITAIMCLGAGFFLCGNYPLIGAIVGGLGLLVLAYALAKGDLKLFS